MNEKIKDFIRNNSGYLSVAIISIVYMTTGFVVIDKTGKTIERIIGDGFVSFLFGTLINKVLDIQGILNGEREINFKSAIEDFSKTVMNISPYIDKLSAWCLVQNKEALKSARVQILSINGMKYDDYFDEQGSAIPFVVDKSKLKDKYARKTEKLRYKYFKKALSYKTTVLSANQLTSEGASEFDSNFLGRTKLEYEKQTLRSDIVSKICISVFFGYYAVDLIKNFSPQMLIWTALQVGAFLVSGIIKMFQSYMFITDEYKERIIKKTNNLKMFLCAIKENSDVKI